jgi:hypothetical protein
VFLDGEREELLDDLMTALNRLASAGCPVTVRNGHLECRAGNVIPSTRGRWSSRPLVSPLGSRPWPSQRWPHGMSEYLDDDGF